MAASNSKDEGSKRAVAIGNLPEPWATAVQLVGTFGLAVFLVLYYVLVIRPEDNNRYEELRSSVESLVRIVEKNHTLVADDLERKLDSIFINAVSIELADVFLSEREHAPTEEQLAGLFEKTLVARTSLFQGLSRRDGRSVSELMGNKIQNFGIPNLLASHAIERWKQAERKEVVDGMRNILDRNLGFIATAK